MEKPIERISASLLRKREAGETPTAVRMTDKYIRRCLAQRNEEQGHLSLSLTDLTFEGFPIIVGRIPYQDDDSFSIDVEPPEARTA